MNHSVKSISTSILLLVFYFTYFETYDSLAGNYWVSSTGTASWSKAKSDIPLSGSQCTTLSRANQNAIAGDTIWLRTGTYNTSIDPANSGSSASNRIIFSSYNNEIITITNVEVALNISAKSYVKVHGIIFTSPVERLLSIDNGASYNELSSCTFFGVGTVDSPKLWDGNVEGGTASVHNWIHGCTFAHTGYLYWSGRAVEDGGGMQIGVPSYDNASGHHTIEDNIFYCGGHHNLETFTKFNVIRNNFFHFEGCMPNNTGHAPPYGPDVNGLWGNRNIQVYDGYNEDKFNLLEGNRFGTSGPPPDDDGGDSFTLTASKNIVRYNLIYCGQNNGILLKIGADSRSDNNRIYNNTIFNNGRFKNTGPQWQGYGIRYYDSQPPSIGNVIKNNILFGNTSGDILHTQRGNYNTAIDNIFENNWLHVDGDPRFTDVDISDFSSPTKPDLSLLPDSPCIDKGTHLTKAKGSGFNSTTLIVEDALYFQDGSWGSALSNIRADWIAVEKVTNTVQISMINYSTNTITLATPMNWSHEARIWLYKNSSNNIVLNYSNPDLGAIESPQATAVEPPRDSQYPLQTHQELAGPNPFVLEEDHENVFNFFNLVPGSQIKILTISGLLVRTLDPKNLSENKGAMASWDGRTDEGELVASGVYLYLIINKNGQSKMGKVMVIRK